MLEKLEKLSKILNEAYSAKTVVSALEDFFVKNFDAKNINIYIYDPLTKMLREFSKNWIIVTEPLNDEYTFKLIKQNKTIGLVEIVSDNKEIKSFMEIASYIISLKVQNIMLAERMQKNVDFHNSMKNIAKIIESQYELSYIIPLIGEMIDKFISNHLIYIFLIDENGYKLTWPNACNDKKIYEMLKELDTKYILSSDKKTGIFPLISEGKLLGGLVTKSMDTEINPKEIDYIEQLTSQTAITINRANVYAEILKHATLDALTGFYNRRQLEERLKQEVSSARRQHSPMCVIMSDIDFFKNVNDTYGHSVGDLVLKTVSKVMRTGLREYDVAGRYGGEEFFFILPFTKIDEAVMVAERLRKSVQDEIIDISIVNPDVSDKNINVTISLGVYEYKTDDTEEDLIKKADKALYQAKESGRNKVVKNNEKV